LIVLYFERLKGLALVENIPERILQRYVHKSLSDPAVIRKTVSGRRLQILSPGRINHNEGPDFLEIAIMLDGAIVVGDAEFHKKSSDWISHNHQLDKRYDNVMLHIVLNNNQTIDSSNFEVLIINNGELEQEIKKHKPQQVEEDSASTLEDLQQFALLRILRKTSQAKRILNENDLKNSLTIQVRNYLNKYYSGRKRPVYTKEELIEIADSVACSCAFGFLSDLLLIEHIYIPDLMLKMLKEKFSIEGAHLRREIVLNCILPLALAIAEEQARINLFLWFWSTPALNNYGVLSRKFPELAQNFLWQQQGMLEYIKEYGSKKNFTKDTISEYGFGELLGFYYVGKTPYK
jgi:hypothetical protein